MESTGRIGEPLRVFEHRDTGERWSSTKSLQFQSDARATNPASVLGFVYSKNLPAFNTFNLLTAGQFTAHDVLRAFMPPPAQFAACKQALICGPNMRHTRVQSRNRVPVMIATRPDFLRTHIERCPKIGCREVEPVRHDAGGRCRTPRST